MEIFVHVGSTLSHNTIIDTEVTRRNSKASQAFGRLQFSVWNRHCLHLSTNLKISKAAVLMTLPYGRGDLHHLHQISLIVKSFPSQLSPPNTEAEKTGQSPGYVSPGENGNLQHPGHAEVSTTAMEPPPGTKYGHRPPKRLFYRDVAESTHHKGGQKRRYKRTLKNSLKLLQINTAI
ncbi:unnamed protein product [Dibothriocephalus latus]|uniref:Uncharacterized protein n=1 Tax=Dibothriocephalus latus TaxID=60516 RepID=A0A3P7MGL4_DIBLA|nr:unnamed protein product [Dibothriocephalus latus]